MRPDIVIPLNSNALSAINAASGQRFALGGRLSSISPAPVADESLFGYSSGAGGYVELHLSFAATAEPQIYQPPPSSRTVLIGDFVTVALGACGASPLSYQWFYEGAPIFGQTNATLNLGFVNVFHTGHYFAIVTNLYGAATGTVMRLTVVPAQPVITQAPVDAQAARGLPFTFQAGAYAAPPPALRWQFNGLNLPGATNSSYTISSAQPAHAGTYTFIASNAGGVVSASAVLQVEPLLVSVLEGSFTLFTGDDLYLTASVSSALPVTYQWRFEDTNVSGITNIIGASGPSLSRFDLVLTDEGNYDVVVANGYGTRTSAVAPVFVEGQLPVVSAPVWAQLPLVGADLLLVSDVSGSKPMTLQWLSNGVPVLGETNANLPRFNLSSNQAGFYALVASNAFGVVTSSLASLQANLQPPSMVSAVQDQQAYAGDVVRLSGFALGGPPPRVQWQLAGTNIPGATNSSLLLTNVSPEQSGFYVFTAANDFGTQTSGGSLTIQPKRALDRWSWRNSRPQANDLDHIAATGGRLVAAGEGGTIVTSTNGIDWTVIALGNRYEIQRVAAGNGVYLAMTRPFNYYYSDLLWFSTNGVNWTPEVLPVEYGTSLDFVNGQFLISGNSGASLALTAVSTNGVHWQRRVLAGTGGAFGSVAYGNGLYVGAGNYGLLHSIDGMQWTRMSAPGYFQRVSFGGGQFSTFNYPGVYWKSSDGRHWTARDTGTGGLLYSVAAGNGRTVVVGGDGKIALSLDGGQTWVAVSSTTSKELKDVVFDGTKFVVSGNDGVLLTSPDGANWTDRRAGRTKDFYSIVFTNGLFTAVGADGAIVTSTNGVSWTSRTSGTSRQFHGLTFAAGLYVAVGREGTVVTSTNAVNWTVRAAPTTNYLERVAWGGGRFVAVGENATIIGSTNGLQWELLMDSAPAPWELEGVAYGQGKFVVVGKYFGYAAHSVILYSTDGVLWSNVSVDVGKGLRGVAHGADTFVAVGNDGTVVTSSDGLGWFSFQLVPPYQNLRHVTYALGRFVAVGNVGSVISSAFGGWETHASISGQNLHDVAYGLGRFVAVGDAGTIVQSEPALPSFSGVTRAGGAVRFDVGGGLEPLYWIEASTNLSSWGKTGTYTNLGAPQAFVVATNIPQRFFRAVSP